MTSEAEQDPATAAPGLRSLLRLALPLVAVNVGMVLMGVVDTIVVGRLSAQALAAVAIANVYYFALSMFGIGVLMALDPIISQAIGARDDETVARAIQRGVLIAAGLVLPIVIGLMLTGPALRLFHQPPEIIPLAHRYALILIPGVPAVLLFSIGRQLLQASHRIGPVIWAIVLTNLLNGLLNYVLIFGHFGAPAMGVGGSALATTTSRILMLVILATIAWPEFRRVLRPWRPESWQRKPLAAILRLGLPIAGHIELEMGAFSAVALLMGTFGTIAVAGHQIALNLASLTFMVPMSVGIAASVLVGHAIGRGDALAVRATARHALQVAIGFMTLTGIALLAAPAFFAQLYTDDQQVIAMAAALLPIAGIFQIFDGIQVASVGILRGLGDTRAPMLINLAGFGVCGVGTSLWLGYRAGYGPAGLWWGLVIGLMVVATVLYLRVRTMIRRPILRVLVD